MELFLDIKSAFLQEFSLIIFIVINIVLSLFFSKRFYKLSKWFALLGITVTMCSLFFVQISPNYYAFNNAFLSNGFTLFMKTLILITVFFIILLSRNLIKQKRDKAFEYFTLLMCATLGAMCLVSSNDFLSAFVSLETLGISSYFLASFGKSYQAKEAGFKYLITGSVASAVLLFGVSYLYGISGTLNFSNINDFYLQQNPTIVFTLACIFILMGAMFKIGCVPFANWVPDVYQGASYPVGAFLSLVPKIAGFAFVSRLFVFVFSFSPILKIIAAIFAVLSIAYGTFGAIRQTNIKRLYGYSSIAQAGFMLLGLSVLSVYGLSTVLFYLFCYIFMNIGVWAAAIIFNTGYKSDELVDYKGLLFNRPFYSIAFTICLISLAGLPPTTGFLSKLYLFSAVSRSGIAFLPFFVVTLLLTIAGVFFYFNVVRAIFEKTNNPVNIDTSLISSKLILYACTFMTVILCLFPDWLIQLSQLVAYYI